MKHETRNKKHKISKRAVMKATKEDIDSLIRFISDQDWESAINFLSTEEPTSSSFRDYIYTHHVSNMQDYCTAFTTPCSALMRSYWLRRVPPMELFQRILLITPIEELEKWPMIIFMRDDYDRPPGFPLFYQIVKLRKESMLTSQETAELLEVLMNVHPEIIKSGCVSGFLPIHIICSSPDVAMDTEHMLHLLIRSYPESVLMENKGGLTPLELFFYNYILDDEGACKIDKKIVEKEFYNHDKLDQFSPCTKTWRCMLLLFRTAALVSSDDIHRNFNVDEDTWPLHMIVQSEILRDEMLDIALDIHGRELGWRDNHGNLPLHCVIKSKFSFYEPLQMNRDDRLYKVMSMYRHAVGKPDNSGEYPIMTVAKIRPLWNYAILQFIQFEPKVLFEKDPNDQFYAFQMISLSCDGNPTYPNQRSKELYTLFQCIRACPELVKSR